MKDLAWVYVVLMLVFAFIKFAQLMKMQKSRWILVVQIYLYLSIFAGFEIYLLEGNYVSSTYQGISVSVMIISVLLESFIENEAGKFLKFLSLVFFAIPVFLLFAINFL